MDWISIGDVSLAVEDRGQGTPLLLVHGFPLSRAMWNAQLDDLAGDFRVIAPDLRGFGESPLGDVASAARSRGGKPDDRAAGQPDGASAKPAALTMERLADDLARLLQELRIDEPIVFCGLSMGGYIAWRFWRKYAARLRGLILCDTRAGGDTPEARENRLRMAEGVVEWGSPAIAAAMVTKLFSPTTIKRRPALVDEIRKTIGATCPHTIAAAQRGMAARADMTASLPTIDAPALLICGEHDQLSPAAEMREIAEAMPRADFVEVAGAGHMAPMEQPAEVNRAIRRFMAGC